MEGAKGDCPVLKTVCFYVLSVVSLSDLLLGVSGLPSVGGAASLHYSYIAGASLTGLSLLGYILTRSCGSSETVTTPAFRLTIVCAISALATWAISTYTTIPNIAYLSLIVFIAPFLVYSFVHGPSGIFFLDCFTICDLVVGISYALSLSNKQSISTSVQPVLIGGYIAAGCAGVSLLVAGAAASNQVQTNTKLPRDAAYWFLVFGLSAAPMITLPFLSNYKQFTANVAWPFMLIFAVPYMVARLVAVVKAVSSYSYDDTPVTLRAPTESRSLSTPSKLEQVRVTDQLIARQSNPSHQRSNSGVALEKQPLVSSDVERFERANIAALQHQRMSAELELTRQRLQLEEVERRRKAEEERVRHAAYMEEERLRRLREEELERGRRLREEEDRVRVMKEEARREKELAMIDRLKNQLRTEEAKRSSDSLIANQAQPPRIVDTTATLLAAPNSNHPTVAVPMATAAPPLPPGTVVPMAQAAPLLPPSSSLVSEGHVTALRDSTRDSIKLLREAERQSKEEEEKLEEERHTAIHAMLQVEMGEEVPNIPFRLVNEWTDGFSAHHKIGEGGFGEVFEAVYCVPNSSNIKKFAVKRLSPELQNLCEKHSNKDTTSSEVADVMVSMKREINVLRSFRHPNIIKLYGYTLPVNVEKVSTLELVSSDPLKMCLVYELGSKGGLNKILSEDDKAKELTWKRRLTIAYKVSSALNYLHNSDRGHPCFHRDVKSANIVLTEDFTAKLIDCGLSKYIPRGMDRSKSIVTRSGQMFGTPGYQCPHYISGEEYDHKSEIFSFGVILAELLTGLLQGHINPADNRKVFFDKPSKHTRGAIAISDLPVDPRAGDWPEECAVSLRDLALKCLTHYDERVESMEIVMQSLRSLTEKYSTECEEEECTFKELLSAREELTRLRAEKVLASRFARTELEKRSRSCEFCSETCTSERGVECPQKHFYCDGCFRDIIKNQVSESWRSHFISNNGEIVCISCLPRIYKFNAVEIAQHCVDDTLFALLQRARDENSWGSRIIQEVGLVRTDIKALSNQVNLLKVLMLDLDGRLSIPRTVILIPVARKISGINDGLMDKAKSFITNNLAKTGVVAHYKIALMCECHPCFTGEGGGNCGEVHEGYDLVLPGETLTKIAPVLAVCTKILHVALLTGRFLGAPLPSCIPGVDKLEEIRDAFCGIPLSGGVTVANGIETVGDLLTSLNNKMGQAHVASNAVQGELAKAKHAKELFNSGNKVMGGAYFELEKKLNAIPQWNHDKTNPDFAIRRYRVDSNVKWMCKAHARQTPNATIFTSEV